MAIAKVTKMTTMVYWMVWLLVGQETLPSSCLTSLKNWVIFAIFKTPEGALIVPL